MAKRKDRVVQRSSVFRAELKRAKSHRKCDFTELAAVMVMLERRQPLPVKYLDHPLQGRYPKRIGYTDCRECHTSNDWLLVYRLPDDNTLHLIRTGTHSDLF